MFYKYIHLPPMVEVFKTNICNLAKANHVVELLKQQFPLAQITIDLDDCDKIMRFENQSINIPQVINILNQLGINCQVLAE